MTRIDQSEASTHCWRSDHNIARIINDARQKAHAKHGDNSIEAIDATDPRWLSILVEEVGEIAHALTYDAKDTRVVDELVDVLAVASAWLDAYRTAGELPTSMPWVVS